MKCTITALALAGLLAACGTPEPVPARTTTCPRSSPPPRPGPRPRRRTRSTTPARMPSRPAMARICAPIPSSPGMRTAMVTGWCASNDPDPLPAHPPEAVALPVPEWGQGRPRRPVGGTRTRLVPTPAPLARPRAGSPSTPRPAPSPPTGPISWPASAWSRPRSAPSSRTRSRTCAGSCLARTSVAGARSMRPCHADVLLEVANGGIL